MAKTNRKPLEAGSISTHKPMITACGNHRMFFQLSPWPQILPRILQQRGHRGNWQRENKTSMIADRLSGDLRCRPGEMTFLSTVELYMAGMIINQSFLELHLTGDWKTQRKWIIWITVDISQLMKAFHLKWKCQCLFNIQKLGVCVNPEFKMNMNWRGKNN